MWKKGLLLGLLLLVHNLEGRNAMADTQRRDDDYQWLEDLQGEQALGWVRKQNERSLALLQAYKEYASFKNEALAILQAKDKIPYGSIVNGYVFNFWQD